MAKDEDFVARQDAHFADADDTHFTWQTRGDGFSEREADFIAELLRGTSRPLLEIGCGEGANLHHAGASGGGRAIAVGFDRSIAKLRFAGAAVAWARYACGDATALPFRDGSFATVVVRDVLHHLPEPRRTLVEATRVLRPGGALVLAEPNRRSPLIRLQMALVPAERGAARSDEPWLRRLLDGLPFTGLEVTTAAPFPLDRVVLHPTYGLPKLGRSRFARHLLDGLETFAGRLLGPRRWSYLVVRARLPAPVATGGGRGDGVRA